MKKKTWIAGVLILLVLCIAIAALILWKRPRIKTDITEENITVKGLKREYRFFFLSDSHISLADERDDEEVRAKAAQRRENNRYEGFYSEDYFDALIKEAGKRDEDLVILGGDIVDSAMYASLEHVEKTLKQNGTEYLYYSGNHDFEYGAEYYSEKAYAEYLPRLAKLGRTQSYQVKEYDDLIIFAADDDSNKITPEALEAFKEVYEKGKPVVLCLHVPLEPGTGDTALWEMTKTFWGESEDGHSRVLLGVNSCYPNETTAEFMNLVFDAKSPVAVVIAGHIHFTHRDMLNDQTLQLVSGAAYEGKALQITLTPAE